LQLEADISSRKNLVTRLALLYAETGEFPPTPHIQDYEIEKLDTLPSIRGAYNDCYKGRYLNTYDVAMKCPLVPSDSNSSTDEPQDVRMHNLIARELHVWRKIKHSHILPFIGLYTLDSEIYMVSPWMPNGNATTYIQSNPNADRLRLLGQAAEGLEFLHTLRPNAVVHGDVRGPNILISESGDACLANFGLSHIVGEEVAFSYFGDWTNPGHWGFKAQEIMNVGPMHRTTLSDIFSFGRTIVEITTGHDPFYPDAPVWVYRSASHCLMPKRPEGDLIAQGLTDDMWALAKECCNGRPTNRPQMETVARRIWEIRSTLLHSA